MAKGPRPFHLRVAITGDPVGKNTELRVPTKVPFDWNLKVYISLAAGALFRQSGKTWNCHGGFPQTRTSQKGPFFSAYRAGFVLYRSFARLRRPPD